MWLLKLPIDQNSINHILNSMVILKLTSYLEGPCEYSKRSYNITPKKFSFYIIEIVLVQENIIIKK
jgi:hypothetical protein